MNEQTCEQCGSELKQIPAGVSKKTGKAYSAFMACPNKCQMRQNAPQAPSQGFNMPTEQFLTKQEFNQQIDKMRLAFQLMDSRLKKIEGVLAAELKMVDELKIPIVGENK